MEAESSAALSKSVAVAACTGMAVTYVCLLYVPRFVLRLPPAASFNEHMLRRFFSVAVSSVIALVIATLLLLPVWDLGKTHIISILGAYGLKIDHLWQAVFFPLVLTALLYLGPLVTSALEVISKRKQKQLPCACETVEIVNSAYRELVYSIHGALSLRSDILAWRNYVVAPLTEELVFRACMIPLLLCGGFHPYSTIFLCPVFFSLAHLNHFWELYYQQNYDISRAAFVVGLQLGYTVIFGWYASFLFIRTGHLVAPIMAHIFCNIMGLPSMSCIQRGKVTTMVFLAGVTGFFLLLAPATNPVLYNHRIARCKCWKCHQTGHIAARCAAGKSKTRRPSSWWSEASSEHYTVKQPLEVSDGFEFEDSAHSEPEAVEDFLVKHSSEGCAKAMVRDFPESVDEVTLASSPVLKDPPKSQTFSQREFVEVSVSPGFHGSLSSEARVAEA